jgi:hypothetical protein
VHEPLQLLLPGYTRKIGGVSNAATDSQVHRNVLPDNQVLAVLMAGTQNAAFMSVGGVVHFADPP